MADIPDASDGLPPVHLSLSREEKKVLLWEMGRRVNAPVGLIESAIVKMARGEEEHGNDIGTVSIDEMLDEIRDLYVYPVLFAALGKLPWIVANAICWFAVQAWNVAWKWNEQALRGKKAA